MKPTKHKASGRWTVRVPAKLSPTGKRTAHYFGTKDAATEFVDGYKEELVEHGKSAVTSEERHWINVARGRLGDLSILPTIIDHWFKTGAVLNTIETSAAVEEFLKVRSEDYESKRTLSDVRWRLRDFGAHFKGRQIHEISAGEIDRFLRTHAKGWSRRSFWKRLRPFYRHAERYKWVAESPLKQLDAPDVPISSRNVYTPEQFQKMLLEADTNTPDLLPFIALSGFAFFRTSELVKAYSGESVLRWEDMILNEKKAGADEIHVREEVGKRTRRRSGNERYVPMITSLTSWLSPYYKKSGEIVSMNMTQFAESWRKFTDRIEVPRIQNGLRKSALSHYLAARPTVGIGQLALWAGNSEATAKQHYIRLLRPEVGQAWFTLRKGLNNPAQIAAAQAFEDLWRDDSEE